MQLSEYIRESPYYNVQKIHFRPCLLWECEAIGLEVLLRGVTFFNVQLGISGTKIVGLSEAICGVADLDQGTRVRFMASISVLRVFSLKDIIFIIIIVIEICVAVNNLPECGSEAVNKAFYCSVLECL